MLIFNTNKYLSTIIITNIIFEMESQSELHGF